MLDAAGLGPNPDIYDWRLSPYTIDLAVQLAPRFGATLVYASLTDFVQHASAPGEQLADDFYARIDVSIGQALDDGFIVGLAADHGMNAKSNADGTPKVLFLDDALAAAEVASAHTLCPITDPYVAGTLRSHGGLHERRVPIIISHRLRVGALEGRDLRNRDLHDLLLNEIAD